MNIDDTLIIDKDFIKLKEHPVNHAIMHTGETVIMHEMAAFVTQNGGDILEVGFGMHISADAIQANKNIKSHTIIEIHPQQYERALEWAKDKSHVEIILGDWINVLPLKDKKFDGVLHNTYEDYNIHKFLDIIKPNCRKGTIVAFFEVRNYDSRLDSKIVNLTDDDINFLPYGQTPQFKNKQYEFKYSTFDGNDFQRSHKRNTLM